MVSFSVLIITHGREDLLLKCLDSLRPPIEKWQLILVTNGEPLSQKVMDLAHTLTSEVDIVNLEKTQTPGCARNAGIELVRYEWVYFIDENAYVYPKYFEVVLPLLSQERTQVLGGPKVPAKGMDNFSQALAITLASPFCTGKSYGRHQPKGKKLIPSKEENLTSGNLWIRTHLLKEVTFPENYFSREETALLADLTQRGVHMFYHPGLLVAHFRRETLSSLWRTSFNAGFYRSKLMREKVTKGMGLYWLPALLVLLHFLCLISPTLVLSMGRIYLGLIVMMSLNLAARKQRIGLFLHIAFLHYFIVLVYGVGFLANRLGLRENKQLTF